MICNTYNTDTVNILYHTEEYIASHFLYSFNYTFLCSVEAVMKLKIIMNKKRFISLLNNCQQIKFVDDVDDDIYYVWNKDIERTLKFNKILLGNDKIEFDFNQATDIYFYQNKNTNILWCDYANVWKKIDSENTHNQLTTDDLIIGWLKEDTKWVQTLPAYIIPFSHKLKKDPKWMQINCIFALSALKL